MVLPDRWSIFGRAIFLRDAWAHHFGQPVNINSAQGERLLDLASHSLSPGLRTEDPDFEAARSRIDAARAEFVQETKHVARRHHHDVRLEVEDQLDLARCLATGHWDNHAAEPLGAIMCAQSAGEQAVSIGDMDLHSRPASGSPNRASD